MRALLDINTLLALAWPTHIHHGPAGRWFAAHRGAGWATCPLTEMGFVRVSAQPAAIGSAATLADAQAVLAKNVAAAEHEFWPMDQPLGAMLPEIRERLASPLQLTDAVLLDLAIRRGGVLVTFDRGVAALLVPASRWQAHLLWLAGD